MNLKNPDNDGETDAEFSVHDLQEVYNVDLVDYGNIVRVIFRFGSFRSRWLLTRKEAKKLRRMIKAALREA